MGFQIFGTLPAELRLMIWKEAILDSTRRIVRLEPGFTLSPWSPRSHVPSDTARILAICLSCKEANDTVLECVRRQHISISPTLAIPMFTSRYHAVSKFTSPLAPFLISAHKDILYFNEKLVACRVAEMIQPERCFRTAPWSKEPPERRPTHFMLDADSCAYLLSPGLLSLCGPYGPFAISEAFLLALGLVPLESADDAAEGAAAEGAAARRQLPGRYTLEEWRSLRVAPTTVTVMIPVSINDRGGTFDMTKQTMNIWTYEHAAENCDLWVQLAVTNRGRLQLSKCMRIWDMVVKSARVLDIEFPITLQFARHDVLGYSCAPL